MTDYKCICCGEAKQSDKDCTCPSCGYKMYPIPFERQTVLVNEIMGFLNKFSLLTINKDEIGFLGMDKNLSEDCITDLKKENYRHVSKVEDSRFPSFSKIQNYVCSSEKIEVFCERLSTTLEQLNKHIHGVHQQKYYVDMANIITNQSKREECFIKAIKLIGVNSEFEKLKFDEITLNYAELPNDDLLPFAENLIELLTELSLKIKLFIKQNNIYGIAYQEKIKSNFKYNELTTDSKNEFEKCINKVQTVLNKKYVVDIFSDGSDELKEMLKVLWNAIYTSMKLPVLNKVWKFSFLSGESFDENAFYEEINSILSSRFKAPLSELKINNTLYQKTEDELFEDLKKMMNLDTVGYFNSDNNNLMKTGKFERELNKLIGLSSIKNSIQKIKAYAITNKDSDCLNINMCFYGNPGTGKTEVARLIAGILYENKILPTNNVVEVDRSGLVSQYFGATAEKTNQVINSALGGVLFIDEAYALGNNSDFGETDYGREAIDTLVKAMEDYRGKICVIFAGYQNQMKKMIDLNPGFKSRIQFHLDFKNYVREEMNEIAKLILSNKGYKISESAINRILDITDVKRKDANFANARELRNILEQVIMCQNIRNVGTNNKEIVTIDVNKYIEESRIKISVSNDDMGAALSGNDELNRLIGLESVKRMAKKINAYAKMNKDNDDFNLHMTFSGNPGTGKTEVARLISRILYDSGILSEAKVIETNAQGLLGKYVGETGPKTQKLIQDAMGGVLFIDEAYSLIHSKNINSATSYGEEAISTLLKSMEDYRGQFCVIFAGYKVEMADLINYNPGLSSRVQFALDFPDYTQDELKEIAMLFLKKKRYEIEDEALSYILDISNQYRKLPNFANARTVRNIVDQVIMNQNLRAEDDIKNRTIIYSDVEEYDLDLKKVNDANKSLDKRIGF